MEENNKTNDDNIKYYRYITHDLFTGKSVYFFENIETHEIIKSNNPNLYPHYGVRLSESDI